jgi:hypothetical protein
MMDSSLKRQAIQSPIGQTVEAECPEASLGRQSQTRAITYTLE